jgi:hypothetical protein
MRERNGKMARIGENFPLSRGARKMHLNEIKKGNPISSSKVPGQGLMPVYRIIKYRRITL